MFNNVLYLIVSSLMKIWFMVLKLWSRHNFNTKHYKRGIIPKTDRVIVLLSVHIILWCFICCTKFCENISKCLRVIERTQIAYRNLQRDIITNTCRWIYGTCSPQIIWWCFIFVPSFMKISLKGFRVIEWAHIAHWNLQRGTIPLKLWSYGTFFSAHHLIMFCI